MACDSPLSIKYDPPIRDGKGGFIYYFPADCGKCLPCLIKRKAQWSYRMVEEKRSSFSSYFVTLTYNDQHLPMTDSGSSGNVTDHRHFIKWLKYYEDERRLQKRTYLSQEEVNRIGGNEKEVGKIKYYGVTEYGDLKGRIHLHYILFNIRDTNSISMAWSEQRKLRRGVYSPGKEYGRVDIDECNVNTIDYVLKYMVKERKEDTSDQKEQERSFMSKGIGKCVVDPEFIRYIQQPKGNQVVNQRGSKIPLPRYFNKKYVSEEVRNKKSLYISKEVAKADKKVEDACNREQLNIDVYNEMGKENRRSVLKNRRMRNYE